MSELSVSASATVSTEPSTAPSTRGERRKPIESSSSPFLPILNKLNPSSLLKWHNFLLSCHLTNLVEPITTPIKVAMQVFTWNVNQLSPQNLNFQSIFDPKATDIFVINLQETISLTSLKSSSELISQWAMVIQQQLSFIDTSRSFKVVHQEGLLGLTTILIVEEHLVDQIYDIQTETLGLGYLRWGNKGCISLTFKIGGLHVGQELDKDMLNYPHVQRIQRCPPLQVQVLNVHLVHGEGDSVIQQRHDSWGKIGQKLKLIDPTVGLNNETVFKSTAGIPDERKAHAEEDLNVFLFLTVAEKSKLGESIKFLKDNPEFTRVHDPKTCVFVSGDTNYRFKTGWDNYMGATFDKKDVDKLVNEQNFEELILRDQLTTERFKNNILLGFKEPEVHFSPTFKINQSKTTLANIKTPVYDQKRLPAYTDRILFVPRSQIEFVDYFSPPLIGSDHLPVSANFILNCELLNSKLYQKYHEEFMIKWDRVLNAIQLVRFDPLVKLCTKFGQLSSPMDEGTFVQNVDMLNLNMSFDVVLGETVIVCIKLQSTVDEVIRYDFKDEESSKWFSSNKSVIEFIPLDSNDDLEKYSDIDYSLNGRLEQNGLCNLTPHEGVMLTIQLKPLAVGVVNKTFKFSVPELEKLPNSQRYMALTINVLDIFLPSIVELKELQFENIVACFEYIFSKTSSSSVLNYSREASSPSDFSKTEWDLVRQLTLWEFEANVKLNEVFKVVYIWLKCHNSDLTSRIDERSKSIYNMVVKLIMWMKLDQDTGYDWFGWVFNDSEELLEVLERENYKFDLNLKN